MITMTNSTSPQITVETLSTPAPIPNRGNEDSWLTLEINQPPGTIIAAVIDGAGARLSLPPLQRALVQYHQGISAAAFASQTVQSSLLKQLVDQPDLALDVALLKANETLQTKVAGYIGSFSPEHILNLAGQPATSDPRRIRLALPACVVTLIRLNKTTGQLEFAHAGDTSLLEIKRSGEVIRHTVDQMGAYDAEAFKLAVDLQKTCNLPHLADAIKLPDVQQLNNENGLRHNYVDENGQTQPGHGCGVIDGLPELVNYIETGTLQVDLQQTEGFCLLSDGMELLAPLDESSAQTEARLQKTGQILKASGVSGLFKAIQQMALSDPHFNQYPRMKFMDDATGVYLRFN